MDCSRCKIKVGASLNKYKLEGKLKSIYTYVVVGADIGQLRVEINIYGRVSNCHRYIQRRTLNVNHFIVRGYLQMKLYKKTALHNFARL